MATAHTGNYSHFGLSFKGFAPEIEQAFATGVFPAALLEKYSWLRKYAEGDDNGNSSVCGGDCAGNLFGAVDGTARVQPEEIAEDLARAEDYRQDKIDQRI